jgi:acetoin utilization protein AcuB
MLKLKNIIKTEDIIKVEPGETLSSALSKLTTSHDAAFIFGKDDKFLGVINPYYCFIKSSYPANAKVEHCAFHPPRVRVDCPICKIAQLFIESKVHYLPVFDENDKFIGIISARRLLSQFLDSPIFKVKIDDFLKVKNKPLVTLYDDETVSTAVNTFKRTRVSKLVIVSKDLKLKGILSYYDLIKYLAAPKNSIHRGERIGNKINFYQMKIKNFLKSYVLTLPVEATLLDILRLIIDKKIGSVVIIDDTRHPIGIITTRDLLGMMIKEKKDENIEIISNNLSKESRQVLGGFFSRLTYWIKKIPGVSRVQLEVEEEKKGGLFKIVLSLIPFKGKTRIITKEGKNLAKVLKKIPHK